jgi:hypothetical protein
MPPFFNVLSSSRTSARVSSCSTSRRIFDVHGPGTLPSSMLHGSRPQQFRSWQQIEASGCTILTLHEGGHAHQLMQSPCGADAEPMRSPCRAHAEPMRSPCGAHAEPMRRAREVAGVPCASVRLSDSPVGEECLPPSLPVRCMGRLLDHTHPQLCTRLQHTLSHSAPHHPILHACCVHLHYLTAAAAAAVLTLGALCTCTYYEQICHQSL